MLRFLRNQTDLPWLCAGDFNEVLHDYEQVGGCEREEWKMEGFRAVVDYAGFNDLGYIGLPYTWDNRRYGRHNVKVRLDRTLADENLLNLFGHTSVQHVQTTESDYCDLIIHLCHSEEMGQHRRGNPFRCENMWQRHENYDAMVVAAWTKECHSLLDVQSSLGDLQSTLQVWGRDEFGSVRKELAHLRRRLEHIRSNNLTAGPSREE
jgi:hypothetical protein